MITQFLEAFRMNIHTEDGSAAGSGSRSPAQPLTWEAKFPLTSLTEIVQARGGDTLAQDAIARLCQKYWYPLYAFLRRRGRSTEDAQDLTQGFFLRFLGGKAFEGFNPENGKLRSYLLGALKHYETDQRRAENTQKHGGQYDFISFEWLQAEAQYAGEPKDIDSPDLLYDRRWAVTLLESVQKELRDEFAKKGKGGIFDVLHPFMDRSAVDSSLDQAAERLGMAKSAVKMAVSRMRKRRRQILRDHIALTVATPDLIDDEIGYLISLFEAKSTPPSPEPSNHG